MYKYSMTPEFEEHTLSDMKLSRFLISKFVINSVEYNSGRYYAHNFKLALQFLLIQF